jgi:hypothetical protein
LFQVLHCGSHQSTKKNASRVDYYISKKNQDKLYGAFDWTGVSFPASLKDVRRFESNNPGVAISCFSLDDENRKVHPLSLSTVKFDDNTPTKKTIDLLFYKEHWVLISSLDRLLNSGNKDQRHYCPRCLHGFKSKDKREDHMTHCAAFKPMRVSVPKPDKNGKAPTLSFKAEHKKTQIPIVIYADSEAINHEIHKVTPSGKTERSSEHRCVSIRARVEFKVPGFDSFTFQCTGDDAADHFVRKLYELRQELSKEFTKNIPMKMIAKDNKAHTEADVCCECKKGFGACKNKLKVRHHDHKTGEYIGAAHADCNLRMGIRKVEIPVFFNNGKGYDNHFIIQAISRLEDIENVQLSVIPDNSEKYKMVNFRAYRFLDSISFLNSGLGTLSTNLIGDDPKNAPRFHKAFSQKGLSEDELIRVTRKGVFPYKWFDSVTKLEHTVLPSQEEFFNDLSGEKCSDEEYAQARWVWERFGCTTFCDYPDLYLEADVLLLADVFEAFRDLCMHQYGLDPAHYITLPDMCIDGAVIEAAKKNVKVELIHTDPDKYTFFERGIRGGVSVVSHRYAKGNNPGVEGYDSTKPNSSIMYLDANNLYGWAMMQYLPCADFKWSNITLEQVLEGQWDTNKGCSVEVDIEYPQELHDNHNDLPLAHERVTLGHDDASEHAQKLTRDASTSCEKLAGHFRPHLNYVCDARLLQYYVAKGLRVTKLHRAMTYAQAQTLKPWIEKIPTCGRKRETPSKRTFSSSATIACSGRPCRTSAPRRDTSSSPTTTSSKSVWPTRALRGAM